MSEKKPKAEKAKETKKAPVKEKEVIETEGLSQYGLAIYEKLELVREGNDVRPQVLRKGKGYDTDEKGRRKVKLYQKLKTVKISDDVAKELNEQTLNSRFVYVKPGQSTFEVYDAEEGEVFEYVILNPNA